MRDHKKDFDIFCKCSLFQGLNKKELKALFSISKSISVKKGEHLIREGEKANEIYIIIDGTLDVVKHDKQTQTSFSIDTLSTGDTVGEMAYLTKGHRTASVTAKRESHLRGIPIDDFIALLEKDKGLMSIFFRVAEIVSKRIHHTNDLILKALKKKVEDFNTRRKMGVFFICIITILSLFSYVLPGLRDLISEVPNSSYVTLPLTVFLGLFLYFLIKMFNIPLEELGVTKKNWKRSLFEGTVFILPLALAIAYLIKWTEMQVSPYFAARPIIDPFVLIQDPANKNWAYWIQLNIIYCLLIAPLQELMSRGCLQGLLEKFLTSKHRVFLSILASNLIFSSFHVIFSEQVALGVFGSGCILGWIYSRTHNLVGCTAAHCIIGMSGLSLFGVSGPLS